MSNSTTGACRPIDQQHWLIRRHGILVDVFDGDGQRFSRLFREAWRQIPLGARRRLLSYWRGRSLRPPTIELTPHCRSDNAIASASPFKIQFSSGCFATLPDDAVLRVLAHELAHILQWANGAMDTYRATEPDDTWRKLLIEEDADSIADAWEFSDVSLEEWREQWAATQGDQ